MIYYLSLGSNIKPEANIGQALQELAERYRFVAVLPIVRTEPCAMVSNNSFLNSVAIIASGESESTLKAWLNSVEVAHGRNRNDPLSSAKDRPLDIDILCAQNNFDFTISQSFNEPYVQASVVALNLPTATKMPPEKAALTTVAVQLAATASSLGHRAATIDFHHTSGNVLIREDSLNTFLQRCKTAFNRQQCFA